MGDVKFRDTSELLIPTKTHIPLFLWKSRFTLRNKSKGTTHTVSIGWDMEGRTSIRGYWMK